MPMNVYARYRSLTEAQRAFIAEKRLDDVWPLDDWITFLAPLAAYDRALRRLTERLGRVAVFAVIPIFLLFIVMVNLSVVLAFVLVGGGVAAAVMLALRLRAVDVPDQLNVTVLPLLTLLREDVPPGEPLDLTLDLRGMTDDKQTSEETIQPNAGRFPKIEETYFDDPWLTGRVRLADGSHLRLGVEARVRKRRVTKRGSSGKVKTKHKHKIKHHIGVRLGVPKRHYVAMPENAPAADEDADVRIVLRDRARRSEIEVRRVVVEKHLGEPSDATLALAPRAILATIAQAYRQVQPAASS